MDTAWIYEVQQNLSSISQNNEPVTTYFTKFRRLCDVYASLIQGIPSYCTCDGGSTSAVDQLIQMQQAMQFLRGLDDDYSDFRDDVLLMSPMPSVYQIFQMVLQEEIQTALQKPPNEGTYASSVIPATKKIVVDQDGQSSPSSVVDGDEHNRRKTLALKEKQYQKLTSILGKYDSSKELPSSLTAPLSERTTRGEHAQFQPRSFVKGPLASRQDETGLKQSSKSRNSFISSWNEVSIPSTTPTSPMTTNKDILSSLNPLASGEYSATTPPEQSRTANVIGSSSLNVADGQAKRYNYKTYGFNMEPGHTGFQWDNAGQSVTKHVIDGSTSKAKTPRSILDGRCRSFEYQELQEATENFSDRVGDGGYGPVYKGKLSDGTAIAVKMLKFESQQGDTEFLSEIDLISRAHHKHVVSLIGYSTTGGQKMLVYEFMGNRSLDFHLHGLLYGDSEAYATNLNWETRMQIAIGSAKGLAYLHEDCDPRIIHRDIKGANILLDKKFNPKISDFGIAKCLPTADDTHIQTRIVGTPGYIAPDYASTGILTEKSDVYAFGIILQELISGRTPMELSNGAMQSINNILDYGHDFKEIVDPRLKDKYNKDEMKRVMACARDCVDPLAERRPKMIEVFRTLQGTVSV